MQNPSRMPVRALIVDDEPLSRQIIREFSRAFPEVEIIGECANGYEALKAAAEDHPDLMFLDIQMPRLSGFDVLELLEEPVQVIFVTAYDQYAIRAFEVHALDYLLKPVSEERFAEAVRRAVEHIRNGKTPLARPLRPENEPYRNRILIKDGANIHFVPVEQVDYIEAQDDYVCIFAGKEKHLKLQRLGELENSLDPAQFVRIHRSYILNLDRLARIDLMTKDQRVAVLRTGQQLPVSRNGYEKIKKLLKE